MSDARERLEAAIRDVLVNVSVGTSLVRQIADAVEAAQRPVPTPRPVWPGLEGEGLERSQALYATAYADARTEGADRDAAERTARTAEAAYHWRSLVASLPDAYKASVYVSIRGTVLPRADLASLADPYDGGGK